ncbi:hypothetical protein [Hansschlegelia zhihuaiae]|uniref:Uncharacterized protein n=1 Tax=Hansschlegelia zhihuaiae TaxID=405005 RepID=A0A4Q0M3R9_9HYPH|nr:hypothetical protein [Hansschlegelia zhihuaiae]RXF67557.1 hypothetical protein EK403_21230 [Hansschlegelia zhihuaiae]
MGGKKVDRDVRELADAVASLEVAISLIGTFSMLGRPKKLTLAVVHLRGFAGRAGFDIGGLAPDVLDRIADRLEAGESIGAPD